MIRFETDKSVVKEMDSHDPIVVCMATCHSLTVVDGKITGDPLDIKMFEATDWVGISAIYFKSFQLFLMSEFREQ